MVAETQGTVLLDVFFDCIVAYRREQQRIPKRPWEGRGESHPFFPEHALLVRGAMLCIGSAPKFSKRA